MTTSPTLSQARDQRLLQYLFLAACALLAQIATTLYFRITVEHPPASLIHLTEFTAYRPYQFRVLVPAIVHFLAWAIHADRYQYQPLYVDIEAVCVFGCLVAFRRFLGCFLPAQMAIPYALMLWPGMLLIHVSDSISRYPYDTPAMLFFIVGMTELYKRRWPAYYAVLALAFLNRESSALIVVAFALTMFRTMPWRSYAGHLAVQGILFLTIKAALAHTFQHNLGSLVEPHQFINQRELMEFLHLQPYALVSVALMATAAALIWSGRHVIPPFVLRAALVVPIYMLGMWFVGVFDEIRAYNEAVPALIAPFALMFYGLIHQAEASPKTVEDAADEPAVTRLAA